MLVGHPEAQSGKAFVAVEQKWYKCGDFVIACCSGKTLQ